MASLQHDDAVRYPARRRAGRAALLALSLVAACGGDRNRATGADTVGASAVTPDSAAMPVTDTATPAATGSSRDSSRDTTRSAAPNTATKPSGAAPAKPVPTTAERPARTSDTATKHAAAPSPKPTAAPAPAADTSAAQQPTPTAAAPAPSSAQDSLAAAENAGTSLRDAYHQAPRDTVSQAVYNGWKQFNLNCARCHGEDVSGTTIAPHLIVSLKPDGPINTKELFMQTVCAGRPAKGMPAWCTLGLGMDKINEIYQYVKGRSDAKISPGRPAVKPQG
jgi:Cytochrome C oxidase, cbb3-type, subunit III